MDSIINQYASILINKWASGEFSNFESRCFSERFAILLGLTKGKLFSHLEPQLHFDDNSYVKIEELPALFLPKFHNMDRYFILPDSCFRWQFARLPIMRA